MSPCRIPALIEKYGVSPSGVRMVDEGMVDGRDDFVWNPVELEDFKHFVSIYRIESLRKIYKHQCKIKIR